MVDVTLHIEHRHAAGGGYFADVFIAHLPVAVADGDAVVVAAQNFADFFGGVAVGNLRGAAFDELGVTT